MDDYNYCEECGLYGDDYGYDQNGDLVSNCYGCPMNPDSDAWMRLTAMKRYCRYKGIACEYATEYGYCQLTGCVKWHEGR